MGIETFTAEVRTWLSETAARRIISRNMAEWCPARLQGWGHYNQAEDMHLECHMARSAEKQGEATDERKAEKTEKA